MRVRIRRLDPDLPLPRYASPGAVGFDLYCRRQTVVPPGEIVLLPTGVAVVSDLMRVAREIRRGSPERVSPFAHERLGENKPLSILLKKSAYYLRFRVNDRPGIIARLAGILAAKNISLDAVLQEPGQNPHDLPFVMTVEPTTEQSIVEALEEMSRLDFLTEAPLALPMEMGL